MVTIKSLVWEGVFSLICQQCHYKTHNVYLGRFRFRVTCLRCHASTVLTFDEQSWTSIPLHDTRRESDTLASHRPTICAE